MLRLQKNRSEGSDSQIWPIFTPETLFRLAVKDGRIVLKMLQKRSITSNSYQCLLTRRKMELTEGVESIDKMFFCFRLLRLKRGQALLITSKTDEHIDLVPVFKISTRNNGY